MHPFSPSLFLSFFLDFSIQINVVVKIASCGWRRIWSCSAWAHAIFEKLRNPPPPQIFKNISFCVLINPITLLCNRLYFVCMHFGGYQTKTPKTSYTLCSQFKCVNDKRVRVASGDGDGDLD